MQAAVDGNEAAARMAYLMSDVSFIYPITPSTPMGELADVWANDGLTNSFGNSMTVVGRFAGLGRTARALC